MSKKIVLIILSFLFCAARGIPEKRCGQGSGDKYTAVFYILFPGSYSHALAGNIVAKRLSFFLLTYQVNGS